MSSPRYVLGVDGGTGGIRAGLFEIATGAPVGFADTPYETRYPHPGWAEQDPRAWWAGMASSVFFTERRHSERSAVGLTGSYEILQIAQAEVREKCANSILVRI